MRLAQSADTHYIRSMSETPRTAACPICGKPSAHETRPFCSKRCADVDLHRWLSGTYAVPVVEDEDEDGMMGEGGPSLVPKDRDEP
jgi:endogenous inhibitor of DNA gyrase (YacG/DUF329 family)